MTELQQFQNNGAKLEQIEANKDKGDEKHKIDSHEAHLVHAKISIPQFNVSTGADESSVTIQKFYVDEFAKMNKENAFLGMKVVILHMPEKNATPIAPAASTNPVVENKEVINQDIDLNINVDELGAKDLILLREKLYSDGKSKEMDKPQLIADIKEKIEFLKEEAQ